MTKQEIVQLMAIIREFYPTYYRNKTEEETKISARLWWDMFQEDDGMQVLAAVKAFVATDTKGFPPSVGQIKQRLVQLKMPDMPDEAEAWKQVWTAIQNSSYHSKEEFEKLHPIVQRVVGQPEMLKAWAMQNPDDAQTVIASNFQRAYRARAAAATERLALPSEIRQLLEQADKTHTLPALPDPEESKRNAIAFLMREREESQRRILGEDYDAPRLLLENA
ncbi:MAG: replicative helicase loader/inhibitor [Butyricicoccus sp.]